MKINNNQFSKRAEFAQDIYQFLDSCKAENIVTIDLTRKSSIADCMIIAHGQSQRFINGVADRLVDFLKQRQVSSIHVEGQHTSDWILVDTPPVIVHLFKDEMRFVYNLEKMWSDIH